MFADCRTASFFRASSSLKALTLSLMFVLCGWSASIAQSITCPEDTLVPCFDVFNFDVVGQATASSNPFGASVSINYSDADLIGEGCNRVITRTWVASFAAVTNSQGTVIAPATSRTCVQVISTVDNQGPVINGVQPVINVQCADDVPGFANATVDACTGDETLNTFASHTGRPEKVCDVLTAVGPGLDWAVWLPDLASSPTSVSASWVFDSAGGKFEQYIDGTARLYGRIVNLSNPSHAFDVDFWFRDRRAWGGPYGWNSELGRFYKNDLGLPCAEDNYINWDYYEMVDGISTLTGDGSLEGDILYLSHMPANYYFGFQVGLGANNKNCNFGISGWFTYEGFMDGVAVDGHGDVNADLDCEEVPVPCVNDDNYTYIYSAGNYCGHCTILKQHIIVDDTIAPVFTNCPAPITQECSDPIPAIATGLTATDNCSAPGDITINFVSEVETIDEADCVRWITRTWEAFDECGNRGECVQVITLIDTTNPVFGSYNHYISVECDEADAIFVTASDNCDENVTITYTDVLQSGGCMGVLARTYRATDNCGNFSETVQYIALLDTTDPTFVGPNGNVNTLPTDITVQCSNVNPVGPDGTRYGSAGVQGRDNCGLDVTITYAEQIVPTNDNCPDSYNIVRTWTATDYCDNVSTLVRTVFVIDTTNPTFVTFPADITISCTDPIPPVVNPTATDNCDANVTITLAVSEVAGSCPQSRDILRVFRGEDNCGNQVVQTQTIRVRDTAAPTLSPANQVTSYTYECDETIPVIQPTAVDNCSPTNTIVYTYVDTLNTGNSCSRSFQRKWTIKDQCNNKSFFFQTINVVDTTAPVITGSYDITRSCDDIDGIYVSATDNCNNITWEYEDTHVSGGCAGTVIRRYFASDICGNVSEMFEQTIHLFDNVDPVAVSTPNFTIQCDDNAPIVPEPVWSDNCDNDLDVEYDYSEEIVGTNGCGDYDRIYTWTATDHCGNSTVAVTRVHVVDTEAPTFDTFPADVTVTCGGTVPPIVYPDFSDNCDDYPDLELIVDTVTSGCYHTFTIERRFKIWDICGNERRDTQFVYIVNDLDQPVITGSLEIDRACNDFSGIYVSVQNPACNIVTWEVSDEGVSGACGANIIRTYVAVNACGVASAPFIQIIHLIDNVAPTVSVQPTNVNSQCGTNIPVYTPNWSDNCDTELETTFTQTPFDASLCTYSYTQTWTATDNCGNTTTISRTINVNDNTDPVFSNIPQNATYDCTFTGEIVIGSPIATDNCDSDVTITLALDTVQGICPAEYQIVRTWTAVDNCGNDRVVTRTINIVDNAGPVFDAEQQTFYTFECGDDNTTPAPTATDACSEVVSITASNGAGSGCTGSFNRTWTATDACGNSSTFVVFINIVDTEEPVFNNCPNDVELSCDVYTLPAPVNPNATDVCDSSVDIDYDQFLFGDVPPAGAEPDGYCVIETPVLPEGNPCGYPVDWGLALFNMPIQYRYYTIQDGRWTRFSDRVEISMTVRVAQLPGQPQLNAGWEVDMTFDNGTEAAEWFNGVHGFKADCGGIAANANEWEYFILQSGATMTGWGSFAGSALTLEHAPTNEYFGYQLGTGANNYNGDENGFGGWFGYSGTFRANQNAQFSNVFGAGDVCVVINCCPRYYAVRQWVATDCSGNSSVCEQTISWDGVVIPTTDNDGIVTEFGTGMEADRLSSSIMAQPNPANNNTLFTFRAAQTAQTSVEIYDLNGKKVADVFVGAVEAGVEYRVDFNVSNLATGVYTYRLTNGSEVKIERLIISK